MSLGYFDDSSNYTSLFLGYVAHSIKSGFGEDGTISNMNDIQAEMQSVFGISSTYSSSYNSDIVNEKYSTDGIWSYPGRTPYQYGRRMLYDFEESN